MNLEALYFISQIIAAVALMVSLIFAEVQIRQAGAGTVDKRTSA